MNGFVSVAEYRRLADALDAARAEVAFLRGERDADAHELSLFLLRCSLKLRRNQGLTLLALWRARGAPVRRHVLDEQLPGSRDSNALSVHIWNLRKRLGDGLVETVPKVGYRLTAKGVAYVDAILADDSATAHRTHGAEAVSDGR